MGSLPGMERGWNCDGSGMDFGFDLSAPAVAAEVKPTPTHLPDFIFAAAWSRPRPPQSSGDARVGGREQFRRRLERWSRR
mmetsp:Transcript_16569/g.25182  ORF Transcript_16569/g.25182 Transcript_16569/m.25182 type:complete len:80 (+) Transcript_16569:64-303(+)